MIFKNNIPFIPQGLEHDRVTFTGGRIGVDMTEKGGVTRVMFFGQQPLCRQNFFNSGDPLSSFTKIFRPYVVIGENIYYLALNDTLLYPFGYQSVFQTGEVKVRHGMTLLNDTIAFTADILENPDNADISLRLVLSQYTKVPHPLRTWGKFEIDQENGLIRIKVTDKAAESKVREDDFIQKGTKRCQEPDGETVIVIASDLPVSFRDAGPGFRLYAQTAPLKKNATVFINFSTSEQASESRLSELRKGVRRLVDGVFEDFETAQSKSPAIKVDNPTVQSFLALAPAMVNAMKVKDIPGVFRAANHYYWAWADSLQDPGARLLWNDHQSVREMLELFRETADPEYGIPGLFNAELKLSHTMGFSHQVLYHILLYNYWLYTGDQAVVKEYFPFARTLLERALANEIKDTGLIEGLPTTDHPEELGADHHDLSLFPNSKVYQAIRGMETLALVLNDQHYAARLSGIAHRCRENFIKYFYDVGKGYYIDSVSSRDFSRREHYPKHGIVWYTSFAAELIPDGEAPRIADFIEQNLRQGVDFLGYPKWDSCLVKGHPNLSCFCPRDERFAREVMRLAGRTAALKTWFNTVDWYWQQHTIPEAHAGEAENEDLSLDNPGCQQMFTVTAWYSIFMHTMAGVEVTADGITIRPQKENMEIKGLVIRDKTIDITADAAGTVKITVDGKVLTGGDTIPFMYVVEGQ